MKSHRPEKVASVIRQVVSEAISSHLNDPRIAPFSSVTRVELSHDLEHARVYVSVLGESKTGRRTIAGLSSASGQVRRLLARELTIRRCPHISFHLDDSIKKGSETIRLIDESMREIRDGEASLPESTQESSSAPSSGEDL